MRKGGKIFVMVILAMFLFSQIAYAGALDGLHRIISNRPSTSRILSSITSKAGNFCSGISKSKYGRDISRNVVRSAALVTGAGAAAMGVSALNKRWDSSSLSQKWNNSNFGQKWNNSTLGKKLGGFKAACTKFTAGELSSLSPKSVGHFHLMRLSRKVITTKVPVNDTVSYDNPTKSVGHYHLMTQSQKLITTKVLANQTISNGTDSNFIKRAFVD